MRFLTHDGVILTDIDSFTPSDLRKALFATDEPFASSASHSK